MTGVIGGPFQLHAENFMFFRLSVAFFSCFLAFRHFSLSLGCFQKSFPVSAALKNSFLFYANIFKFSVTQKCNFLVSGTLIFSSFLQNFFPIFLLFRHFFAFLPLRHKYNAPHCNSVQTASQTSLICKSPRANKCPKCS